MTDNEIIKALECFAIDKDFDDTHCIGCAFEHQFCTANMSVDIAIPSLDLIDRQKAEIERLNNNISAMATTLRNSAKATRAEAIKVFAELVKRKTLAMVWSPDVVSTCDYLKVIDDCVKEMVGDDNA